MIDERENLKNDLEEVLNSYVTTLGVHSILGELYPLLKHTEFKYALMLRDFYLTKEKADAPPMRELTDEEIAHELEKFISNGGSEFDMWGWTKAILKRVKVKNESD